MFGKIKWMVILRTGKYILSCGYMQKSLNYKSTTYITVGMVVGQLFCQK